MARAGETAARSLKGKGETSMRKTSTHFKTLKRVDVPQGRSGKHKQIVTAILKDLDKLKPGSAIEVPLSELAYSKEKIRSAVNRATRKARRGVAPASDAHSLYIWNTDDSGTR